MVIQDDCVRKNQFDFSLSDVIEDDSKPKIVLNEKQEKELLTLSSMTMCIRSIMMC